MPGPTGPAAAPAPSPWDLERCPATLLAQRYADLQAFVSWLKAQDVPAPTCWYTHGWLVHRLAALQAWKVRAYAPDAYPRDAAEWWAVGLAALQRDWEPCLTHEGRHPPPDAPWDDPVPIPEFGAFVKAALRDRAEHPPASATGTSASENPAMNQLSSRWGPGPARVVGRLLIAGWLALLGWWIYTGNVDEVLAWVVLTVFGWWFIPLVREFSRWLWWQFGWHWWPAKIPPPSPPPPLRICCGRDYRGWVSAPGQIAVLVLGPPRSGKTRGVIIPNVAAWGGAVLVTSTRRDVLDATCARRAQMGTVWVFDPLGVVGPLPPCARRLVWSPLRGCRDWDTARQRAEALAVDTGRGVEDATHWRTRATQLCAVLLHAAALEDRSMATVCAWTHAQRAEPAHAFCQKAESQAALAILHGLLRTPDRERGSIWSALQGMLSPFDTTRVCQAADATPEFPFDPDEFFSGANTVYVVSPSDAATDGAPLVVGLVEELRLAALRISGPSGALPIPWLLALDEVATICPLPVLPRLLAEGGGRNMVTLIAMQDLRQAAARWTPAGAASFLTLAGAKVVLPGYADTDTLQQLETLVGRHLVSLTTTTSSRTKRHSQRHDDETESTSQSFVEQPRLPASAWRSGYPGSAWVLIGAGEPQQIYLIDPDRTQPFADWLRPAEEAPQSAEVATLPPEVTTDSDAPAATAIAKRTAALLRDARSVQRRLDTLAAAALAIDDPSLPRIAEAKDAVERLVVELTYRERGEQRRAKTGRRTR